MGLKYKYYKQSKPLINIALNIPLNRAGVPFLYNLSPVAYILKYNKLINKRRLLHQLPLLNYRAFTQREISTVISSVWMLSRCGLDRLICRGRSNQLPCKQLSSLFKASGSAVMTSYRMLYKPAVMGKAVNKMGELKHVNNGVLTICIIERQQREL